ncbi:hypothetical protein AD98_04865, partial [Klebsiella pneumoniae MGH 72]
RLFRNGCRSSSGEVYLQMVYFAFTLVQFFLQGTIQRLLFGKETFQFIDIVRT